MVVKIKMYLVSNVKIKLINLLTFGYNSAMLVSFVRYLYHILCKCYSFVSSIKSNYNDQNIVLDSSINYKS